MLALFGGCRSSEPEEVPVAALDVHPGGDIQAALDTAARYTSKPAVRVHAGTYRPSVPGQAFLVFNSRHDGIRLEAVGEVVLTAANPELADPKAASYPAVVNHVVYFGDQISPKTVLRGFKITGANGYVEGPADLPRIDSAESLIRSTSFRSLAPSPIEENQRPKSSYFYTDGGGVLVWGHSYPTIENVEFYDHYSTVCGAAASVQHEPARSRESVRFKDCTFRNNCCAVSGGAVDVLSPGSWAEFDNCLFVANVSNKKLDANGRSGHGALSVFPQCTVMVSRCTFTGNWSGVDDRGVGSSYCDSIFWNNKRPGGLNPRPRFELDITNAGGVSGCFIHGETNDLRSNVITSANAFDPPDPDFDDRYTPRNPRYAGAGYRPAQRTSEPNGP